MRTKSNSAAYLYLITPGDETHKHLASNKGPSPTPSVSFHWVESSIQLAPDVTSLSRGVIGEWVNRSFHNAQEPSMVGQEL